MIAEAVNYLEAIERLPRDGTLVLYGVPWEEYEEILVQMEDKPACRVSYNSGVLKIMSPRADHEYPKDVALRLVSAYAEEMDIMLESYGSTTYRERKKAKGAEPDTSFYVQNAEQMIARDDIDLEKDPPPDVVVEVDTTNESLDKLEIYAALGVPEVWRFDGRRFQILVLGEKIYGESDHSLALPLITADVLSEYLERGRSEGQTAMLKAFRRFLQSSRK
jgi:Uma2 family endonuclease